MTLLNLEDVDPIRCKDALTNNINHRASGKTIARLVKLVERARLDNVGKEYLFVCENEDMVDPCLCQFEYFIIPFHFYTLTRHRIIITIPIEKRKGIIGFIKDKWFPIKRPTSIIFNFVSPSRMYSRIGPMVDSIIFDLTPETQYNNKEAIEQIQKRSKENYE